MIPQIAPINPHATMRRTPDSAWPLRGADGLTFAERKARLAKEKEARHG